ncbi:TAXI family TRAP transporter solute-binding subunit [Vibrio sp.]|uniref:TAXI family TRAP transporter solute-binding subunit n=1 Tax=Vibrio sp. TaxID=678 RepID=UPI003D0B44FB
MKGLTKLMICGAAAATVTMSGAVMAKDAFKDVTIIAQQPGTSFYSYATTISQLLKEDFPAGSSTKIVPRGGSVSNPTLLNAGKGDFAFTLSYTAKLAYDGDEVVYTGRGPHSDIAAVTGGMNYTYTYILARRDFVERTGAKSLEDMLKMDELPRFAMKPQGPIVLPIADVILSPYNYDLNKLRSAGKLIQGQPSQISEMLRDKRADVYFEVAAVNHPGLTEVTLTNDMVFLPISDNAKDKLIANGMVDIDLPRDTYRGMDSDYHTVATGLVILANKNTSEDVVYEFTKSIVENNERLKGENKSLATWEPKDSVNLKYTAVPLHPGAAKFYKEKGWM